MQSSSNFNLLHTRYEVQLTLVDAKKFSWIWIIDFSNEIKNLPMLIEMLKMMKT